MCVWDGEEPINEQGEGRTVVRRKQGRTSQGNRIVLTLLAHVRSTIANVQPIPQLLQLLLLRNILYLPPLLAITNNFLGDVFVSAFSYASRTRALAYQRQRGRSNWLDLTSCPGKGYERRKSCRKWRGHDRGKRSCRTRTLLSFRVFVCRYTVVGVCGRNVNHFRRRTGGRSPRGFG
jgi:hypothetical protein